MTRAAIAVLLVLAACDDPSGVSDSSVTGLWVFQASDLVTADDEAVCGASTRLRIVQNGDELSGTVEGTTFGGCTDAHGGYGYGSAYVGHTVTGGRVFGQRFWMRGDNWHAGILTQESVDTIRGDIKITWGATERSGRVVFSRVHGLPSQ